jgi:hypothetical protein
VTLSLCLYRTLTRIAAALVLIALASGTGAAQGTVTPAMHARMMKADIPAAKQYRDAGGNKAFAVCIDWSKSTGGNVVWLAEGHSFGLRSQATARQVALSNCDRLKTERKAQNCNCQIVDVNGVLTN